MPRFVLLYHDCPPSYGRPSHWDFMLESGDVLRAWALEQLPCHWHAAQFRTAIQYPQCGTVADTNVVTASALGHHRCAYLDLEGPLSGDRGGVLRVAAGTYRSESESRDCWRLTLSGDAINGPMTLTRCDP